jgi:hypothetical protein
MRRTAFLLENRRISALHALRSSTAQTARVRGIGALFAHAPAVCSISSDEPAQRGKGSQWTVHAGSILYGELDEFSCDAAPQSGTVMFQLTSE